MVNLPKSGQLAKITPEVHSQVIQEATKETRKTSKELQASLISVKVGVHDSTIRKQLGKNGIHWRLGENHSWPKKTQSLLGKNSVDYKTKVGLFGKFKFCYILHKTNTAFHRKSIKATIKHVGDSVMVRGCFATSGPGQFAVIDECSVFYQKILKEDFHQFVS